MLVLDFKFCLHRRNMKKIVFILAASLWGCGPLADCKSVLYGGCGPLIPVVALPDMSKHQEDSVGIYTQTQLIGKKYTSLKSVEGNSCKNKLWDPAATKSDAIHHARYHAMKMGADGITSPNCEHSRPTTVLNKALSTNCWESITCFARAIKFDD